MIGTLSKRLRAVAAQVIPGQVVADVGCDHAQLAIELVASGRVPSAIASDVCLGPLQQARAQLSRSGVDRVELRHGHGLSSLRPGEATTIVLAGMGGGLMQKLLLDAPAVTGPARRLVLQPNTQWEATRRFVAEQRWTLEAETLQPEGGHTYLTLAIRPRPDGRVWSDADLLLGPLLRRRSDPAFEAWLDAEHHRLGTLIRSLSAALGSDHPRVCELRSQTQRLRTAASAPQPTEDNTLASEIGSAPPSASPDAGAEMSSKNRRM